MPRTATKWLIAFFAPDGTLKDAVERTMFIRPVTWAQKRCSEGETFTYWNISHPEDEKNVRAMLDHGNPTRTYRYIAPEREPRLRQQKEL